MPDWNEEVTDRLRQRVIELESQVQVQNQLLTDEGFDVAVTWHEENKRLRQRITELEDILEVSMEFVNQKVR